MGITQEIIDVVVAIAGEGKPFSSQNGCECVQHVRHAGQLQ